MLQVKRQLGVSGAEVDDGIGGYDYNNDNDCANFCPNTEVRVIFRLQFQNASDLVLF